MVFKKGNIPTLKAREKARETCLKRNKENNPMWNLESKNKMRDKKIGIIPKNFEIFMKKSKEFQGKRIKISNKTNCQNCRIEFAYYPKSCSGKFCSRKCYWASKINSIPWNKGMKYEIDESKYCITKCGICDKDIKHLKCRKRTFCSKECQNINTSHIMSGKIAWNKGKKWHEWMSEEQIEKMKKIHIGKKQSKETIEKRRQKMLGHKVSKETREKISKGNKGKVISKETREKISNICKRLYAEGKIVNYWKGKKFSKEYKEKLSKAHMGYKMPESQKRKIGEAHTGEKHHNWKGGISKRKLNRCEWRLIRRQVLIKYDFKCLHCGEVMDLCIHHEIPYRICKQDKIENLIPLCRSCHIKEEWRMKDGR